MLVFKLSEWFRTRPQIIFNILEPNLTIISLHYEILCTMNSCLFGFVATRILFDSLSAVEHIVKVFWNIGMFSQSLHEAWAFLVILQSLQERHRCQLMLATLAMSEWTFWPKEADALISWQLSLGINKFDIRNYRLWNFIYCNELALRSVCISEITGPGENIRLNVKQTDMQVFYFTEKLMFLICGLFCSFTRCCYWGTEGVFKFG